MEHDEQSEKLSKIVGKLLGRTFVPSPGAILGGLWSPFDTSKPNIHDTKKEFQKELDAVESALESTRNILFVLRPSDKSDPTQKQMADRLSAAINLLAWKEKRFARALTASELITRNAVEVGFFSHTLQSLIVFFWITSQRGVRS